MKTLHPIRLLLCSVMVASAMFAVEARAEADARPLYDQSFRLELDFGWTSLMEDPDVDQGFGGGLLLAYGLKWRFGAEASAFVSLNSYKESLGDVGAFFFAGNLNFGGFMQLLPPMRRYMWTLDVGWGPYLIVSPIQPNIWVAGIYMGTSFGYRVTRWFGVGVRVRYHLFNLATMSGPDLIDVKAFKRLSVIDRFEMPFYAAFYF